MNQAALHFQEFHVNPRRSRRLEILLITIPVLTLIALAIIFYNLDLYKASLSKGTEIIDNIIITIWILSVVSVIPLFWLINRRLTRLGRVQISEKRLDVDQGIPSWLGGKFSLEWNELAKVNVIENFGVVHFYKKTSLRPLALRLTDWIPIEQGEAPATSNLRSTSLWAALQSIDAFRYHLEKRSEEGNDVAAAISFDLAKHPATRVFLMAIGLLTIVLFADNLLTSEAWAEWQLRYILPHMLIGCLVGIGVGGWLLQVRTPRKIPYGIAITLAWLTVLIGGIASWLGGIHLNQWLGEPLEAHAYTRNAQCDTLLPKEADLPPIEYTHQAKDYWCQFPQEQEHAVLIRRGLGGLYTVDLAPHTKAIREFRAQQKNSAKQ